MSTLREAQPPMATAAATASAMRDRLAVFAELVTLDLHFTDAGQTATLDASTAGRTGEVPRDFRRITATGGPQLAKNPWECSDSPIGQPIASFPDGSLTKRAGCQI
jgi:hypothetical protein